MSDLTYYECGPRGVDTEGREGVMHTVRYTYTRITCIIGIYRIRQGKEFIIGRGGRWGDIHGLEGGGMKEEGEEGRGDYI